VRESSTTSTAGHKSMVWLPCRKTPYSAGKVHGSLTHCQPVMTASPRESAAGTSATRGGRDGLAGKERAFMSNTATTNLHNAHDLRDAELIAPQTLPAIEQVAARYAVAITPAMAELIDPSDPHDPLARQFVPDVAELDTRPEESADPIGDESHSP